MIVNPRSPRDVEFPTQIAVIIPLDSIVPAIVLPPVIGIAAVIDEMIGIDQIPAGGEGQVNAIPIILGGVAQNGVIAGMICQIEPFPILGEIILLKDVVIAVIREINSLAVVHGPVSQEVVVPGAVQVYAGIDIVAGIVVCNPVSVAGFRQRNAIPIILDDGIVYDRIVAGRAKRDGGVAIISQLIILDDIT